MVRIFDNNDPSLQDSCLKMNPEQLDWWWAAVHAMDSSYSMITAKTWARRRLHMLSRTAPSVFASFL